MGSNITLTSKDSTYKQELQFPNCNGWIVNGKLKPVLHPTSPVRASALDLHILFLKFLRVWCRRCPKKRSQNSQHFSTSREKKRVGVDEIESLLFLTTRSIIMPATVYLVTGGARSGKSGYAQRLCESICKSPIYLATSKVWDLDFQKRIEKHRADRGEQWTTIEEPLQPSKHADMFASKAILVDCLTLWLTNYFEKEGVFRTAASSETGGEQQSPGSATDPDSIRSAADRALEAVKAEFDIMTRQWNATFILVTNEIGSGTHASDDVSRKFVDAQGWLNQYVAARAQRVIHMVCGIPNTIKEEPTAAAAAAADRRNPLLLVPTRQRQAQEAKILDTFLSARSLTMDTKGYFMVQVDHAKCVIRSTFHSCIVNDKGEVCDLDGNKISCCDGDGGKKGPEPMATFEGRTAKELMYKIFEQWEYKDMLDLSVGHAAYMGREAQKAETALYAGEFYQQD
jgi:adenosylcobinamide kinase / adenosylcobinamide-phosphate guanylyltransferase